MIVVSFFTPGQIYRDYAKRLKASCDALGLKHWIVEHDDQGSWVENCARKGPFCFETMEFLDCPMVWIDVDAVVKQRPVLLDDATCDFAVNTFHGQRRRRIPGGKTVELPEDWSDPPRWFNSGTVFFGNTDPSRALLAAWADLCLESPHELDQILLQKAWCQVRPETLWLPESYCSIWQREGPAVIAHELASVKHKVNRE